MKCCQSHTAGLRSILLFACSGLLVCSSSMLNAPVAHALPIGASASTQVTSLGGGNFEYRYTLSNISEVGGPNIVAWGMPFFDDADTALVGGESSIFVPAGWDWIFSELTPADPEDELWSYVAADDPKNDTYGAPGTAFDNPPYALVFFTIFDSVAPQSSLGDFGYVSSFSGVNVPFIAAFDDLQLTIGDPIGPLTPSFPLASSILSP